jgi:hypothetical protein
VEIVRFASLKNFAKLDIQAHRMSGEGGAERATNVCFEYEKFPIACCEAREEVFSVVSFTEDGQYRVDFQFSDGREVFASIPFFFEVTGASPESQISPCAVCPPTRFGELPPNDRARIEPSLAKIVTVNQCEKVSVTVSTGKRLAVNLHSENGRLAPCRLQGKTDGEGEVTEVYALTFPDLGKFALRVHVDGELVFEQQYVHLDMQVPCDPNEEQMVQEALAERLDSLTKSRLLTDIPPEVKTLVDSWIPG